MLDDISSNTFRLLACFVALLMPSCNRTPKTQTPGEARESTSVVQPTQAPVQAMVASDSETDTLAQLLTNSVKTAKQKQANALDPARDGWTSEVVAAAIQGQLEKLLTGAIAGASDTDRSQAVRHSVLGATFSTTALRPLAPKETKLSGGVTIRSGGESDPAQSQTWAQASGELLGPLKSFSSPAVNVKVVRTGFDSVSKDDATSRSVESRCLIEISATDNERSIEQHLEWSCDWNLDGSQPPKLERIQSAKFQETRCARRWFTDQTAHVIGGQPCYQEQLQYGLNHWLGRIETAHGMYVFAEYGLAMGDVNGDGLEDVYVCQPGGLPNRLLIHQADGTVQDTAEQAGVDWLDHTSSALIVDFDNDGDQDLALAIENRRVLLLKNDGTGIFQLAQELKIEDRHVQGLSAADFNNDSLVDLYLTVGFADELARPDEERPNFSYHDANEGGANVLFENRIAGGQWQFQDVTRQVGLDLNNRRHSLAASWEDFDNDGDQDLYVANDYGQNCLYRNDADMFTDIASVAGVVDFGSGMSVSWSDFDRDGWMDVYVGNMFSSAGSRITRQDDFRTNADKQTRDVLARFAKGNTLFRNDQGRSFHEPPGAGDIQMGRWAWSSPFADLNNDGWPDLLVANGYATGADERDL